MDKLAAVVVGIACALATPVWALGAWAAYASLHNLLTALPL